MREKCEVRLRWLKRAIWVGALALGIPALHAHDTWVLPDRLAVPAGSKVVLDLTSGMAFPQLDFAVKSERIRTSALRLGGKTSKLASRKAGAHSLRLAAQLPQPGIATLWIELAPKTLELTPPKVQEYLDEIGASPEVRAAWEGGGPKRRWRESYTKHAKTFVRVGEPGQDGSWAEPAGLGLEIVPEKDPTALRAGDDLPVRLLLHGEPLAAFPIGLVHDGDPHGQLQSTDAAGRTTVRLPQAGRWLLRATQLRPAHKPDLEWESDFSTLTIEVR